MLGNARDGMGRARRALVHDGVGVARCFAARQMGDVNAFTQHALDVMQRAHIRAGEQRDGVAGAFHAPGAPDAMQIVIGLASGDRN